MIVDLPDRLAEVLGVRAQVHRLVHVLERVGVDRLEADQQAAAAAVARQLQDIRVLDDVEAGLRAPLLVAFLQAGEELPRPVHVLVAGADDVVVDDENALRLDALDLFDDVVGAAQPVARAIERRHRAEVAVDRAAATGLHRLDEILAAHEVTARHLQVGDVGQLLDLVVPLHLTLLEVLEDFRPDLFGFAADHGVDVAQRFLRHIGSVDAAHDHRDAALPEMAGDLVGARRERRHAGDADEIGVRVEVELLDRFVDDLDLVMIRRIGRDHRQVERRNRQHLDVRVQAALERRIDEQNFFHRESPYPHSTVPGAG